MTTPRYVKFLIFGFCLMLCWFCANAKEQEKPHIAIEITNDVYIEYRETTVLSWLVYYRWKLETEGVNAANKVLPDSSAVEPIVWKFIHNATIRYIRLAPFMKQKDLPDHRFMDKDDKQLLKERDGEKIAGIPITGLSYEQAVDYCKWKTKMFGNNEWVYCLPTQSDWELVSLKMMTEKEWKNRIIDSIHYHKEKEYSGFNFKYPGRKPLERFEDPVGGTPTFFDHDKPYTYDVFGNVSEMLNIKGIAKGGNFASPAIQAHLDSVQYYDKPQRWLGFRCMIKSVKIAEESQFYKVPVGENEVEDERDTKRYRTVTIGGQTWMAENLAYKCDTGVCNALYNDESYVPLYGYLYSWETAQNVCPNGWKLPDTADYSMLLQALNITDSITAYKELSVFGSSGFLLIHAGSRVGKNFGFGDWTGPSFWLSNEKSKREGLCVHATPYPSYNITINPGLRMLKTYGSPVRCLKKEQGQ